MVHAYHYGPYDAYKIRNSNKTYVFPVVVSYNVRIQYETARRGGAALSLGRARGGGIPGKRRGVYNAEV